MGNKSTTELEWNPLPLGDRIQIHHDGLNRLNGDEAESLNSLGVQPMEALLEGK